MSMITGVGDEVVEVICLLVVVSVAALAWWSTAARPDRFRTVIVMERTSNTTRAAPRQLSLIRAGRNIRLHLLRGVSPAAIPSAEPGTAGSVGEGDAVTNRSEGGAEAGGVESEAGGGAVELAGSTQAQEMDRIVDAMDANVNVLRHRRLDFFTRSNAEMANDSAVRLPSSDKTNEHSNAERNDTTDKPSEDQTGSSTEQNTVNEDQEANTEAKNRITEEGTSSDNANKINIKLKYLNDTLKDAEGSLDELLKDFKWRHFASELTAQLRVLLIFNGHVLSEDASTLRSCGLFHNCVVHCLVHPQRQTRSAGGEVVPSLLEAASVAGVTGVGGAVTAGLEGEGAVPQAEGRIWDLENVLMTLVSIILTIIWFFRCEYSNVFTASASGALFALTVFYSVAIFGLYFSDTFHFSERPQRRADNEQAARQAAYT